jgi:FtsH-binding integral membrane protein
MQTTNELRLVATTLAAALLLVAAGLIASGLTALAPLPAGSHAAIVGAIGSVLLFLLAAWLCRNGVYLAAALPYFLACACNGLMLAPLVGWAMHDRTLAQLVNLAAFTAAGLFGVLAFLATVLPRLFIGGGRFLLIGLLVFLAVSITAVFVHATPLQLALDGGGIWLFCSYVLYDIDAVTEGEVIHPVHAAIGLYLDGLYLFWDFLRLLWRMLCSPFDRNDYYREPGSWLLNLFQLFWSSID